MLLSGCAAAQSGLKARRSQLEADRGLRARQERNPMPAPLAAGSQPKRCQGALAEAGGRSATYAPLRIGLHLPPTHHLRGVRQEDEMLCSLVDEMGSKHWSRIARQMVGRNGKQCRERCVRIDTTPAPARLSVDFAPL